MFLDFRDTLWPEIFENLAVGLSFYIIYVEFLQNGQQRFFKFDP